MSKHASPTVIGTFVIAGIALAIAAVVILGGGRLFPDTARVIVFFDGSVAGLRIGAPVKFRGIDIGTVKVMQINMGGVLQDPDHVRIPVVLEIDKERLRSEGVTEIDMGDRSQVQALVDAGLRAGLATESVVTGIRYVSLDVQPGTPATLVNDPDIPYPEIPSIPSSLDEMPDKLNEILTRLSDKLEVLDVEKMAQSLDRLADDAHRVLDSPDLRRAVAGLDELTASLHRTVAELEAAAHEVKPAIQSARQLVAADGPLATQLDVTLKEIASAARSMRRLGDQVGRDPGSIVRGGRP